MRLIYYFYHFQDFEKVAKELSKYELKRTFKKFNYTEIFSEGIIVGKYDDVAFVISDKPLEIGIRPLGFLEVVVDEVDGYVFEGNTLKIDKVDEKLIKDVIPALLSEYFKLKILIGEAESFTKVISKHEHEIIGKFGLCSEMLKVDDISTLEKAMKSLADMHTEFFRKLNTFKSMNSKLFKSLLSFESLSKHSGMLKSVAEDFRNRFDNLKRLEEGFENTLNRINDVFTLISLRLDTLRNREYLELHRKTSSLQVATAVIEFVAVFYYTLKIWDYFIELREVPNVISFSLLTAFAVGVLVFTDALGEALSKRKVSRKIVIISVCLVVILALMINVVTFSKALGL
ncbi:hypothetical protein [Archaeoglobus sp.]